LGSKREREKRRKKRVIISGKDGKTLGVERKSKTTPKDLSKSSHKEGMRKKGKYHGDGRGLLY